MAKIARWAEGVLEAINVFGSLTSLGKEVSKIHSPLKQGVFLRDFYKRRG